VLATAREIEKIWASSIFKTATAEIALSFLFAEVRLGSFGFILCSFFFFFFFFLKKKKKTQFG
jgi:hypothetical protein